MQQFDKSMAIDMIDDALQAVGDPVGRGIAIGLCSAFYLCGLLKPAEWERYQERILEGASSEIAATAPPAPSHEPPTAPDYFTFPGNAGPVETTLQAKSRST